MDLQGEGVDHIVMEVGPEVFNNLPGEMRGEGRHQDPDGVRLEIKKVSDDY